MDRFSLFLAQCVSSIDSLPKGYPAIQMYSAASEGELVNNFLQGRMIKNCWAPSCGLQGVQVPCSPILDGLPSPRSSPCPTARSLCGAKRLPDTKHDNSESFPVVRPWHYYIYIYVCVSQNIIYILIYVYIYIYLFMYIYIYILIYVYIYIRVCVKIQYILYVQCM
jgi:hypothetical protein